MNKQLISPIVVLISKVHLDEGKRDSSVLLQPLQALAKFVHLNAAAGEKPVRRPDAMTMFTAAQLTES